MCARTIDGGMEPFRRTLSDPLWLRGLLNLFRLYSSSALIYGICCCFPASKLWLPALLKRTSFSLFLRPFCVCVSVTCGQVLVQWRWVIFLSAALPAPCSLVLHRWCLSLLCISHNQSGADDELNASRRHLFNKNEKRQLEQYTTIFLLSYGVWFLHWSCYKLPFRSLCGFLTAFEKAE